MSHANLRAAWMNLPMAGPLFMLLAAISFTCLSMILKLMPAHYTVWHLGFVRCFGGMLLLAGIGLFGNKRNPFQGHRIPLLIIRGLSGSIAFFFVVTALRILPISTAVVLFYAYPAFAALFGFLIYKETLNRRQMICIAVLIIGVAILFDFRLTGNAVGQIMAIVGAFLAGFTVTVIRSLRANNGPVVIYFYFCVMGTLAALPYCMMNPIWPASSMEWLMIGGIVIVSVTAQLLMNQGFFFCRGFEGAAYMSTETLFTAFAGIVFLGDPVSWHFIAGALLIVGAGMALHRLAHTS